MSIVKRLCAAFFAATLLLIAFACTPQQSPQEAEQLQPIAEEPAEKPSESEETVPEPSAAEEAPTEQEFSLRTELIGNIRYSYRDDITTTVELEGLPYIYYSDTAFFFAESLPITLAGETFTTEDATLYFNAAEASFNEGTWSNGTITTPPVKIDINGLEVWLCEAEMNHENGVPFTCTMAALYYGDLLTTFTLLTDDGSYNVTATEFVDTLYTLGPA